MKFILGTKLGMSRIFDENGRVIAVSIVACEPSVVTQVKTVEKDGYKAVQIGYGAKKKLSKAMLGHLKDLEPFRWLKETRVQGDEEIAHQRGESLDVSLFEEGERVRVTSISKGKGFQGVVKRWGFHGSPKTHGTKNTLRAPGSIGAGFPQHVRKGMKMAGRMGGDKHTTYMEVVKVNAKENVLFLNGPIPGNKGGLVEIRGTK